MALYSLVHNIPTGPLNYKWAMHVIFPSLPATPAYQLEVNTVFYDTLSKSFSHAPNNFLLASILYHPSNSFNGIVEFC